MRAQNLVKSARVRPGRRALGTNTDALIKFEVTTDNVADFSIGVDDSDGDKFKISTTALGANDRLVIDSAGLVGIGTSTPTKRLHIEGTSGGSAEVRISTDTDADGERSTLSFSIPAGEPRSGMFGTSRISNTMDLALFARGPAGEFDAITILGGSGFVGIGHTAPDNMLDVRNTFDSESAIAITSLVGDPLLKFELADTVATFSMGVDRSDSAKLKIGTTGIATNTRMTIDSTGNVGINTTSPASKLEVNGDIRITGGSNFTLKLDRQGGDEGGQIDWQGGTTNADWIQDIFFTRMRIFCSDPANLQYIEIMNTDANGTGAGVSIQKGLSVGVGSASPSSTPLIPDKHTFEVRGTLGLELTETAASSTDSGNQVIIGVTDTSAARAIVLQTAATVDGRTYWIKDQSGGAGTNNITISTQGSETIDGDATLVIASPFGGVILYANASNWFVIAKT